MDLTEFFDDWILQPGWAAFEVDSFSTAPQGGEHLVTVHVEQKLRGADHPYSGVPITFTCTADDGSSWTTPDSLFVGGTLTSVSHRPPSRRSLSPWNTDERLGPGDRCGHGHPERHRTEDLWEREPAAHLEQRARPDAHPPGTIGWPPILGRRRLGVVVSPDGWWRVQADLPPGTDIEGRVLVDARPTVTGSLDLGLVQGGGGSYSTRTAWSCSRRSDASSPGPLFQAPRCSPSAAQRTAMRSSNSPN